MVRSHRRREAGIAGLRTIGLALAVTALVTVSSTEPASTGGRDEEQVPADGDSSDAVSPDIQVRVEIDKPERDLARGRALFAQRCASCHGHDGTGNGPTARHLSPKPTDFTRGVYKIRSTPQGTAPTQEDLYRSITRGVPGTGMPGWMGLPAADRWQLVFYLESLSDRFETNRGKPIHIPEAPPATVEMIERGRAIYHTLQCVQCHGESGRGNGPGSGDLTDDRGRKIYPFDFSRSSKFKGGSGPRDIYRTVHTGLDGTPMKSFAGMLTDRDSWALVHYIRSLRVDRPKPIVVAETEQETFAARARAAGRAAAAARAEAAAAREEADKARAEVAEARALVDQLLAAQAEEARAAAEKAAKERAERARAARQQAAEQKQAAERRRKRRAVAAEARKVFKTRCAACHGPRGQGDGPASGGLQTKPRDFGDPSWQASISNSKIEKVIVEGGPSIGKSPLMPANPDLAKNKEVLQQIRRMIRGMKRK